MKALLVSLALLLAAGITAAGMNAGQAPDFTLKSNSGDNLRLEEHRGEVVMLNFWASWCAPCRQEMPHLRALNDEYAPLGFTLLGVNVDEDLDAAKRAIAELNVDFPVVFDDQSKVAELFDVDAMPTTIIIDRDGNVRHLHRGYKPGYEKAYGEQVANLIREM